MINRIHDLSYHQITPVHTPGIKALWKVVEAYNDKTLTFWYQDQDGERWRACKTGACGQFGKRSETKADWLCNDCNNARIDEETAEQNKALYKKKLDARCKEAAGAARKQLPSANIRKGRNRNVLVFDRLDEGVEALINSVLGRFNLTMGYASPARNHPNYWRRQAELLDISPFRGLEKIINGEGNE
jgi:hypothetical protein